MDITNLGQIEEQRLRKKLDHEVEQIGKKSIKSSYCFLESDCYPC